MGEIPTEDIIEGLQLVAPQVLVADLHLDRLDPERLEERGELTHGARYGWLHYMIPRGEAEKLSDILKSQSKSPPPGQPRDKPH